MNLPRTIWMLWLQGWGEAPALVEKCMQTWKNLHPGWKLQMLDEANLSQFVDLDVVLPRWKEKNIGYAALSDVVRIALLKTYGGVWVDATVYCTRPLDSWIAPVVRNGFFAYAKPGPDRMVSSWFIAAEEMNPITAAWYHRMREYWNGKSKPGEYFWFHYLFGDLYREDATFAAQWDHAPKILAAGPHYFLPYKKKLFAPVTRAVRDLVESGDPPMLKLTHKFDSALYKTTGTVLEYLLTR